MTWVEFDFGLAHRDGVPWWNATVHHRWQPHRAQTRGTDPRGQDVYRCACGAFGPAPWTRLDPWPTRKKRRERNDEPYEPWASRWRTQLDADPAEAHRAAEAFTRPYRSPLEGPA